MFCLFGASECASLFGEDEVIENEMHSNEQLPAAAVSSGCDLLVALGRLIVRSRSASPARVPRGPHARRAHPGTSDQIQTQPLPDVEELKPGVDSQLADHVQALWTDQIPVCIEVLLAGECPECRRSRADEQPRAPAAVLLERWTMRAMPSKSAVAAFTSAAWLLNAVRSQLHFSQLSAWRHTLAKQPPHDRRRKLSRETCNYKKIEANCDDEDLVDEKRKLNIVYSIRTPGDNYLATDFHKTPINHQFPTTDIGNNTHLKIVLESLPRLDDIPIVKCTCQKRRASKEIPVNIHEELTGKLNDLTIGNRIVKFPTDLDINSNTGSSTRRLSIVTSTASTEYKYTIDKDKMLDDRMLTPCSENGKHKCNCDEESDGKDNKNNKTSTSVNEPKKLDERRLKEIAKYKRRLRKESKLKKLCDSTSSEGDVQSKAKETHTSIPILQAARFDRFRAIGCYRNQTYLTLPASRIESKSPFMDTANIPIEIKRTCTVATQTEDICPCGTVLQIKCGSCNQNRLVRSEANYNLASLEKNGVRPEANYNIHSLEKNGVRSEANYNIDSLEKNGVKSEANYNLDSLEKNRVTSEANYNLDSLEKNRVRNEANLEKNGARRKCEEEEKVYKKPKCDNTFSNNKQCDNIDDNFSVSDVIKRPKLRRIFPIVDKLEKIVSDRSQKDIEELHLKKDDTVFSVPKQENKRQKTFSINDDDYVFFEKCDYGTIDKYESDTVESPVDQNGFKFPEPRKEQVPSPSEMDKFRYRFDSAASMVFHKKTGLPLTSSPAPLRRGNNCFDFDDSINGISGIKSALFHPISPEPPGSPASPAPRPASPASPVSPPTKKPPVKVKMGPSSGLLGSFEECALQGRLAPVATVAGFTAELAACGATCPPHRRLPVTVFFYAPGGTNAPYMGHINLGPSGYRVARSGTIQVSLFNPHGTLVKMFVVLYDLTLMPPRARTFLRQRTLYLPATAPPPPPHLLHKWLRYSIHLRFMTSKSGKLYLHTDIRIIVSRKADLDTATAHSVFRPIAKSNDKDATKPDKNATKLDKDAKNHDKDATNHDKDATNHDKDATNLKATSRPNRVFGGSSEFDSEIKNDMREIGYENQNGVSYELRSFTYAPENPKYSPR